MIRPIGENVLIKPIPKAEQPSTIILTTTVQEKVVKGEVLAIGKTILENGSELKFDIEVGEHVLYDPSYAIEIKVENEIMFLIAVQKILCAIA